MNRARVRTRTRHLPGDYVKPARRETTNSFRPHSRPAPTRDACAATNAYANAREPRYRTRLEMAHVNLRITKRLTQGLPFTPCDDVVTLPAALVEQGEVAICLAATVPTLGLYTGDLLIVHPRKTA